MADVAVVIPAYNEAPRIADVVRAALAAHEPRRVVVVDDGSTDGTTDAARQAGAEVLVMPTNGGKARAMDAGVRAVFNNGILFLDADLVGIRPEEIDAMIEPWLRGIKMVVGTITDGQKYLFSVFAGPRTMARATWLWATTVEPSLVDSGYGVEVVLAALANRYGWTVAEVQLDVPFVDQASKWGGSRWIRSAKMWGRVLQTAAKVGGIRAWDDIWRPMLANRGWEHLRSGRAE